MSTERLLVHKNMASNFRDALNSTMSKMFGHDGSKPKDAPILVAEPGVSKNKRLLEDAISKGRKVTFGDINATETRATRMWPVAIEDVKKEMDIYCTESFEPIVALYTLDTDD
jgi:acyl-CoA reductase-like NAD-dependent aldehyde dehydrogenase